ncbi:MAG: fibronectin type III domain-containing protein [Candidatus Falkowbacteria bacterium]|nr:fibronectin type III domain-containing protein [Candidatus Falkowbacteria bacterium]
MIKRFFKNKICQFGGIIKISLQIGIFLLLMVVTANIASAALPTAPSSAAATAATTTSKITWTWNDNSGDETGFTIDLSTDGITFTNRGLVAASATTTSATTTTSLTPNSPYWLRVAAYNTDGTSTYATSSSAYTKAANVTSQTSTASSSTSVDLSWGANNNPSATTSYAIDYGGAATTTTYNATTSISGLTPNTSYTFTIHSQNHDGTFTTGVTVSDYTNAAAVTTASSTASSTTSVSLSWGRNSNPAVTTIYKVSGGVADATTTNATTTISSLTPNTSYTFTIQSQNNDGTYTTGATTSDYTTANNASFPTVNASTSVSVTLSWNANSNSSLTDYRVNGNGTATSTATAATTTTVTGLTPHTNYTFTIQALQKGDVTYKSGTTTTSYTKAADVTSLTPTLSVSAIDLSWGTSSNPSGTIYQVSGTGGISTATTTNATSSVSSLTANTQYTIYVKSQNHDGDYNSAVSVTKYTLTNVPSSVGTSVSSDNKVTVSWTGDTAESYYVDNLTNHTNSGWTTYTTWTDTALNCGTTYTYQVKGRNGDLTETTYASSVTATTNTCGGGGSSGGNYNPPTTPTPTPTTLPVTPITPIPPVAPTTEEFAQKVIAIAADAAEIVKVDINGLLGQLGTKEDATKEQTSLNKYVKNLTAGVSGVSQETKTIISYCV